MFTLKLRWRVAITTQPRRQKDVQPCHLRFPNVYLFPGRQLSLNIYLHQQRLSVSSTNRCLKACLLALKESKAPSNLQNLSLTPANNLFLITCEQLSHHSFMGVLSFPSGVLYLSGVLRIERGPLPLCRAL